jgi:glycosyltransferase involved in cell wall biosynthesis
MNKILIIEGDINNAINGFRKQLINSLSINNKIIIIGTNTQKNFQIPSNENNLIYYNLGYLDTNPFRFIIYLFKVFRIIVIEKPFLCLSFNLRPNIAIGLICKFYPIKSITTITGTSTFLSNINFLKKIVLQFLFKNVNYIVFQNLSDKNLFEKYKININKFLIVPGSGIDLTLFNFEKSYKNKSETTFILISRIIKEKGVLEYIEAAEILKNKGYSTKFQLVGPFYLSGKKNSKIDKSTINLAVQKNIIEYFGETKNVIPYIIASDCVVLPSYREGMSNLLLEAASLSTPIITTNVPGCHEIVENEYNGFLCNPKDSHDLSQKMIKFLELNENERELMGKRGRIKIEKQFDKSIVIKQYMNIVEFLTF